MLFICQVLSKHLWKELKLLLRRGTDLLAKIHKYICNAGLWGIGCNMKKNSACGFSNQLSLLFCLLHVTVTAIFVANAQVSWVTQPCCLTCGQELIAFMLFCLTVMTTTIYRVHFKWQVWDRWWPSSSVPCTVKGAKEYTFMWPQFISTKSNSTRKPFF